MISHINGDGHDNRVENLRITGYNQGTRTRRKRDESLCLPKGIAKVENYYRAHLDTSAGKLFKSCASLADLMLWVDRQTV